MLVKQITTMQMLIFKDKKEL